MTEVSKIKLSDEDFVLVRMNYSYYMISRWAYTKNNHDSVKQQTLNNKKMVKELRTIWNDVEHGISAEDVTEIMER